MQTTFAPLESMLECAQGAVNNTSNYIFKYSVNGSARVFISRQTLYTLFPRRAATFEYVKRHHVKNYTVINFNTILPCAHLLRNVLFIRRQNLISKEINRKAC
jgi:hypothetical protein